MKLVAIRRKSSLWAKDHAMAEHIQKYPTMVGIVQQFDEEHETINFLRPNNIQIEKITDEIFEEEWAV